jgi:hypothetical protein
VAIVPAREAGGFSLLLDVKMRDICVNAGKGRVGSSSPR